MPSWLNNGLIFASYTLLIAAVSLALHRAGGVEVQAAVLIGAVMLLFAGQVHALVGRIQERATAEAELRGMRTLTAAMTRDMEQMRSRMEELEDALDTQTAARNEQISSEVRLVETLVKGLAESVEAGVRGGNQARRAGDRPDPLEPGQTRLPLDSDAAEPVTEGEMIETIRNSLEENRVDLYLQPIVTLPQRRTRFYEGLSRLRGPEGEIIMPGDYLPVAGPAGMMPTVDNLLLLRAVQVVRKLNERDANSAVFCNISANSLLDGEFFPRFIDYMEHNKELANQLVFEFSQSTVNGCGPIEIASLQSLARLGFRFSMDQVTDINLDLRNLHDLNFKYVKVAADILVDQAALGGTDIRPEDIKDLMSRYGMDLIVDQIEQERSVVDVLDFNVDYGQGYLFGNPRLVREEVLANVA